MFISIAQYFHYTEPYCNIRHCLKLRHKCCTKSKSGEDFEKSINYTLPYVHTVPTSKLVSSFWVLLFYFTCSSCLVFTRSLVIGLLLSPAIAIIHGILWGNHFKNKTNKVNYIADICWCNLHNLALPGIFSSIAKYCSNMWTREHLQWSLQRKRNSKINWPSWIS